MALSSFGGFLGGFNDGAMQSNPNVLKATDGMTIFGSFGGGRMAPAANIFGIGFGASLKDQLDQVGGHALSIHLCMPTLHISNKDATAYAAQSAVCIGFKQPDLFCFENNANLDRSSLE
jgi:hypothetical protein